MRILLPPSEGKTAPTCGPRFELGSLSFPDLQPAREQVLGALVGLCRADPDRARDVLGLGPSLSAEIGRNADLPAAVCAPAGQVYSGVLYAALDPASLPVADGLLITGALFGLVGAQDPIPAYRLGGSVALPGLQGLRKVWGPPLARVLAVLAEEHLVVDLRSQTYAAWCRALPPRMVAVRVMMMRDGRRVSVSHHNKSSKGLLARDLVRSGADPGSGADLVDTLRGLGWDAAQAADGAVEVLTGPSSA